MKLTIVTEKPSVAKHFRNAFGLKGVKKENNVIIYYGKYKDYDIVVVPLAGHVLELDFGKSKFSEIPLIPDEKIKFSIIKGKGNILKTLKKYVKDRYVVFATDYDREGELIAYEVYKYLKIPEGKHFRMIFSTFDPNELRKSLDDAIRKKQRIDLNLAYAGLLRAYLDKIFGFNYTRFMTLLVPDRELYSIGRVQTPTLRIIVERERVIRNHVKTPILKFILKGKLDGKHPIELFSPPIPVPCKKLKEFDEERYKSSLELMKKLVDTLPQIGFLIYVNGTKLDKSNIEELFEKVDTIDKVKKSIKIKSTKKINVPIDISRKTVKVKPPKQFSTTIALSEISNRLNIKSDEVMKWLQKMYEAGEISYPRTDSETFDKKKYNSSFHKERLSKISKNPTYKKYISKIKSYNMRNLGSKVDDAHPPIHPVKSNTQFSGVGEKIFDIIVRRYISGFYDDMIKDVLTVKTKTKLPFVNNFEKIIKFGWKEVEDPKFVKKHKDSELPNIEKSKYLIPSGLNYDTSETQPPGRFTSSSIIKKMESLGLGTKSTRAEIIKTLRERKYITIDKKNVIKPTPKGEMIIELIDKLNDNDIYEISTPEFTSNLEDKMNHVSKGKLNYKKVIDESKKVVSKITKDKLEKSKHVLSQVEIPETSSNNNYKKRTYKKSRTSKSRSRKYSRKSKRTR